MNRHVFSQQTKLMIASGLLLGLGLLTASCGAAGGALGAVGDVAGGGGCPDVTKPESILAFDFASSFKINGEAAAKLKAATAASVEIKGVADQIDADLKAGCGPIAKDLGAGGDFKDGKSACDAAIKAIGDAKAKLGANAKVAVTIKEPKCSADLHMYADCAGKCDAKVSGPKAKVDCEPGKMAGKCDAQCEGSCDMQAAAKCDGQCNGSCDAEVKGSCSGKCNGKCDGKTSSGAACAGNCEGKCEGGTVKGECKGKCGGSCQLKAGAKCDGQCTGKCSVEFKEPKCTGEVKPPEMSADCKAHCDADIGGKMECTPAQVGVAIVGAADAQGAAKLQATLEKNLPMVLKVAIGMGEKSVKLAGNVSTVVDGAQATVKDLVAQGGAKAALTTGKLGVCLGDTFKGAVAAAGSIQANVKVSANVSASASGSAGGGASSK